MVLRDLFAGKALVYRSFSYRDTTVLFGRGSMREPTERGAQATRPQSSPRLVFCPVRRGCLAVYMAPVRTDS